MQIDPANSLPPRRESLRRVTAPTTEKRDEVAFTELKALDQKLHETPEVRPDAVARARSLVEKPEYPPEKTIQRIAILLAAQLEPESE